MMAIHDVSRELRGPHGEWARGGSVLHRMTKEATSAQGDKHAQVLESVKGVSKGTGKTIGGHRIDRTQKDKYRVGLKTSSGRDTRLYNTPEDAAQAIHEGKHHDAGAESAFRKATAKPEAKPEAGSTGDIRQRLQKARELAAETGSKNQQQRAHALEQQLKESKAAEAKPEAGALSPEMQRMVREAEANAKAAQNARDKAMGSTGVTEHKDILGKPDMRGGATPPKGKPEAKPSGPTTEQLMAKAREMQAVGIPAGAEIRASSGGLFKAFKPSGMASFFDTREEAAKWLRGEPAQHHDAGSVYLPGKGVQAGKRRRG